MASIYDDVNNTLPEFPNISKRDGAGLVLTLYWQNAQSNEALVTEKLSSTNVRSSAKIILGQLKTILSNARLKATSTNTVLSDAEVA
jgi:hypothetical protein